MTAPGRGRPARVADVHALAMAMPHVTIVRGSHENPVYQVGGKSFVYFRNPRPDAVDPATGERYEDVIVIWVESEDEKQALVQDEGSPFFTTPHFNGHLSVLVRASRLGEITRDELAEVAVLQFIIGPIRPERTCRTGRRRTGRRRTGRRRTGRWLRTCVR